MRSASLAIGRRVALTVVAGLALAGCTTTVSGHGAPASTVAVTSSAGPSFPSTSTLTSSAASTAATAAAPTTPGATGPAATTPGATGPAATTPGFSRTQAAAQLAGLTPGRKDVIVTVPGGLEGAALDQVGHVSFWRHTSTWSQVGSSTYPYDAQFFPAPLAKLTGALLSGMTHATFIATGLFSGDGSGNAVAYTTGSNGWGAIKAEPNGNIGPSGRGVAFSAIGLSDGFAFSHGLLMSADCSDTGPISDCGGNHRVFKYWRWAGHDFVLHSRAGLAH